MSSSKVAVVTGGTSGIGKATALALQKAGCTVYELSRRAEGVEGLRHISAVQTIDQPVQKPGGQYLRQKREEFVVKADGVQRVVIPVPQGDGGDVRAGLGGIHTRLLVVLHALHGPGNASLIDSVPGADLPPRGGEARVDILINE